MNRSILMNINNFFNFSISIPWYDAMLTKSSRSIQGYKWFSWWNCMQGTVYCWIRKCRLTFLFHFVKLSSKAKGVLCPYIRQKWNWCIALADPSGLIGMHTPTLVVQMISFSCPLWQLINPGSTTSFQKVREVKQHSIVKHRPAKARTFPVLLIMLANASSDMSDIDQIFICWCLISRMIVCSSVLG